MRRTTLSDRTRSNESYVVGHGMKKTRRRIVRMGRYRLNTKYTEKAVFEIQRNMLKEKTVASETLGNVKDE